ncbi:uncharacterized protein [Palaemon carinicauda]|uniref:uncharacterized protein n=1 Tax=Palaemon carinicauda TaxID=392227 RepID=UPI0035B5B2F8
MGVQFLVDTGACRSLLPRSFSRTRRSLSKCGKIHLVAANGSVIPTHCQDTLTLSFGSDKYIWKFLGTDVTLPILGADFLSHFHILVDVAHRRLVNGDSYSLMPLQTSPSNLAFQISALTDAYAHLLISYPEVLRQELCQTATVPVNHDIYHHIKTTGAPVFARFRCLTLDCLVAAKQMFAEIEEIGLCQKTSSQWSSPSPIVLKKDDSLRPCEDYRHLIMQIEPDY